VLTVLKAALNFVHGEGRVSCRPVWSLVKPYRAVDAARLRYLSDDESRRLVNACEPEFRDLVKAALVTGCRYGELAAFTVEDFNPDAGAIRVRTSKSGKARHVYLTDEGQSFFSALARRRKPRDFLLKRTDGKAWRSSDQQRPLARACKAARLVPLTFHELRHTYASRLVMNGAPLPVVARQLGHSDTRMVEKHYGHMAPSYVADTVSVIRGLLLAHDSSRMNSSIFCVGLPTQNCLLEPSAPFTRQCKLMTPGAPAAGQGMTRNMNLAISLASVTSGVNGIMIASLTLPAPRRAVPHAQSGRVQRQELSSACRV
jgi:Phage integrase family